MNTIEYTINYAQTIWLMHAAMVSMVVKMKEVTANMAFKGRHEGEAFPVKLTTELHRENINTMLSN